MTGAGGEQGEDEAAEEPGAVGSDVAAAVAGADHPPGPADLAEFGGVEGVTGGVEVGRWAEAGQASADGSDAIDGAEQGGSEAEEDQVEGGPVDDDFAVDGLEGAAEVVAGGDGRGDEDGAFDGVAGELFEGVDQDAAAARFADEEDGARCGGRAGGGGVGRGRRWSEAGGVGGLREWVVGRRVGRGWLGAKVADALGEGLGVAPDVVAVGEVAVPVAEAVAPAYGFDAVAEARAGDFVAEGGGAEVEAADAVGGQDKASGQVVGQIGRRGSEGFAESGSEGGGDEHRGEEMRRGDGSGGVAPVVPGAFVYLGDGGAFGSSPWVRGVDVRADGLIRGLAGAGRWIANEGPWLRWLGPWG